jgi:fermentation-respiration switch protein FrsA (DUF1100 family)
LVKEIAVPEIAEFFQRNGITALIYDHRSYGDSDGLPRNDVDPEKQCEDCSDALTFLSSLPIVDPTQVGLWGTSFSAMVCLKVAALDRRFKLAIVVSPALMEQCVSGKVHRFLARCMKDREARLKGNEPFRVPLVTEVGTSPLGFGPDFGVEAYNTLSLLKDTIAPNYENEMTLQTWLRVLSFSPLPAIRYLSPTPVFMVIPELDTISPPHLQKELFDALPEPKRLYNAIGMGHIDVVVGDGYGEVIMAQLNFFRDVMSSAL